MILHIILCNRKTWEKTKKKIFKKKLENLWFIDRWQKKEKIYKRFCIYIKRLNILQLKMQT